MKAVLGRLLAPRRQVACAKVLMLLALCPVTEAVARTYTTYFPSTENPISEGGNWINGKAVGVDWADISTTPGLAVGLESGSTGYDDATALLTGTWGPNQTAMATVYATNRVSGGVYEEVEIRLRSALSAHSCTGYEVLFSLRPDSSCYVQIVRWNGALNDFTYVAATGGSEYILHTGDTVMGAITNDTITAYINGTRVLEGTDSTYATGSPGMGIFLQGATGVNHDYGFTSFTATDEMGVVPSPNLTLTGPGTNGTFTLQFDGIPGTAYRIQYADKVDAPSWEPLGTGVAGVGGLVRFADTPPPGARRRFYRSVWP